MAFISPKVNTPSSETAWNYNFGPFEFSKNSKGKFYKSVEIKSTIAKLRVWYNSNWVRLALGHHQLFITGHRTYTGVIIVRTNTFLALSYPLPNLCLMLCFVRFQWRKNTFISLTNATKKRRENSNAFSILIVCFYRTVVWFSPFICLFQLAKPHEPRKWLYLNS